MVQPVVSVIVPTRNRAGLVTATIRSVLNQQSIDLELIVVDDASTDETAVVLAHFDDDRIKVVRHRIPRGVSVARNAGVAASSGAWLAFVDDDDLFAPDKLAVQVAAVSGTPEAQWSCVGVVVVNGSLRVTDWMAAPHATDLSTLMLVEDAVPGGGSGVLVSRDLLDDAGSFDPDLSCQADWDMWLRLAQRSPIVPVNRPLLAYRMHRSAMSLAVEECDRELHALRAKHATLFTAKGLEPDRVSSGLGNARLYLRSGQRRRALRTLYDLRDTHEWRRLSRSALVSMIPGSLTLNDERLRRNVPRDWRVEADAWLAAYR